MVDLERQLARKEQELKEEVSVRNDQMGILQRQCARAHREIDSLKGEVAEKDTHMTSILRELGETKGELGEVKDEDARLSEKLLSSEAEQQVLEENLREMETSFNDTVQKRAEDTLYGIWFHYPDLDYSRVDPSYEEKTSEWWAERAAAQEALGGEVRGSNVPAVSEEAAGDGLAPLFTPPLRVEEIPLPPPPPVDEPIPPPPADDPAPVLFAELGSTLSKPPADPALIIDLSPVREDPQELA